MPGKIMDPVLRRDSPVDDLEGGNEELEQSDR